MKKFNLALLGCGHIANFHIEAFKKAGFNISHCSARKESSRAERFSIENSIPNFLENPYELIKAHNEWDMILMAIDTNNNFKYIHKIIETNKPCLIEKPVSFSLKELSQFKQNDHPHIRVAYNRRFYKTFKEAKKFIKNKKNVTCRMELPEIVDFNSESKYSGILSNSVHGIDILLFLFGNLEVINTIPLSSPDGRLSILRDEVGNKISVLMNWNSPSNFSLELESNETRMQIKPFELCRIYKGMEVIEPSEELPLRRYIPKKIQEISSFPSSENMSKPGFFEQALEMKKILQNSQPQISATLHDAYLAQKTVQEILYVQIK